MSDERWPGISWAQERRKEHLQRQQPVDVRTDIRCPDCGAKMALKLGRYGRFYGCANWSSNGCKGGVSARDDGSPAGIPAKARIRVLRKQVMDALQGDLMAQCLTVMPENPDGWPETHPNWPKVGGVGKWGEAECLEALHVLRIEPNIPVRTRWERILSDPLFDDPE